MKGVTISFSSIRNYTIVLLLGFFVVAFIFFSTPKRLSLPIKHCNKNCSENVDVLMVKHGKTQPPPTEGKNSLKQNGNKIGSEKVVKREHGNTQPQRKEKKNVPPRNGNGTANFWKMKKNPSCELEDRRFDICKIKSDVRIVGESVLFATSNQTKNPKEKKTWKIKPFPRKFDKPLMKRIREVTISPLYDQKKAPECTAYHNTTVIVFAMGNFMTSLYHSFVDLLIPLFITARQFDREVQFVIADQNPFWVDKFRDIFNQLSKYEILDLNKAGHVHCYPRAIVGLYRHKELSIDPSIAPNNYTTADFTKLMREAYSLTRNSAINLRDHDKKSRLRLLILTRSRTRRITNIGEVIPMVEELGFEVSTLDSSTHTNVKELAQIVNTFDVMMGVYGDGLTNEIFLPTNAVLIQIVPFGNLEPVSLGNYGSPASKMNLWYLQYNISIEESTLLDRYPRAHPVFTAPNWFHKQGWGVMSDIYLKQQSVKLNLTRFVPVLEKARELLS